MNKSQFLGRSKIANQEKYSKGDTTQVTQSILENNQNLITQLEQDQEHYDPLNRSQVRNTYLQNITKPEVKSGFRQQKKRKIWGVKKQGIKKSDIQMAPNTKSKQENLDEQHKGQFEDAQENLNSDNQVQQSSFKKNKIKKQVKKVQGQKFEVVKNKSEQISQMNTQLKEQKDQDSQEQQKEDEVTINLKINQENLQNLIQENQDKNSQQQNVKKENKYLEKIEQNNNQQVVQKQENRNTQKLSIKQKTQKTFVIESFSEQSATIKTENSEKWDNDSKLLQKFQKDSLQDIQEDVIQENKQYQFNEKQVQIVRHRVQSYEITQQNNHKIIQNQYSQSKQIVLQNEQNYKGQLSDIKDEDFKQNDSNLKQIKKIRHHGQTQQGYIDHRMVCKQMTKKIGNKVLKKQYFKQVTIIEKDGKTIGQCEELAKICVKQINRKSLLKLKKLKQEDTKSEEEKNYKMIEQMNIDNKIINEKKPQYYEILKLAKIESKKINKKVLQKLQNKEKNVCKSVQYKSIKSDKTSKISISSSSSESKQSKKEDEIKRNMQQIEDKNKIDKQKQEKSFYYDKEISKNLLKKIQNRAIKKWEFQKKFERGKEVIDIEKLLYGNNSIQQTEKEKSNKKESFQEAFQEMQDQYIIEAENQQKNKNIENMNSYEQIQLDANRLLSRQVNVAENISNEKLQKKQNTGIHSDFRKKKKNKIKKIVNKKNEKQLFNTERNVEFLYSTVQIDYENIMDMGEDLYEDTIDTFPFLKFKQDKKDNTSKQIQKLEQDIFEELPKARTITFQVSNQILEKQKNEIKEQQKQRTITFQVNNKLFEEQQHEFWQEEQQYQKNSINEQDEIDEDKSKGILSDDSVDENEKNEHKKFIFRNSFSGVHLFDMIQNEQKKDKEIQVQQNKIEQQTNNLQVPQKNIKNIEIQKIENQKEEEQKQNVYVLQDKEKQFEQQDSLKQEMQQKNKKNKKSVSKSSSVSSKSKTSNESDFKKFVQKEINKDTKIVQNMKNSQEQCNERLERRVQTEKQTFTQIKQVNIKQRTFTVQQKGILEVKQQQVVNEKQQYNKKIEQKVIQNYEYKNTEDYEDIQENNQQKKEIVAKKVYRETMSIQKQEISKKKEVENQNNNFTKQKIEQVKVKTIIEPVKEGLIHQKQIDQEYKEKQKNQEQVHEQNKQQQFLSDQICNENTELQIQQTDNEQKEKIEKIKQQQIQQIQPISKYIYDPAQIHLRQNLKATQQFDIQSWYNQVDKQQEDYKSRLNMIQSIDNRQQKIHYLHKRTYEMDQQSTKISDNIKINKKQNTHEQLLKNGTRSHIYNFLKNKNKIQKQQQSREKQKSVQKQEGILQKIYKTKITNESQSITKNNIIENKEKQIYQNDIVSTNRQFLSFKGLIQQSIQHQRIKAQDCQNISQLRIKTQKQVCK